MVQSVPHGPHKFTCLKIGGLDNRQDDLQWTPELQDLMGSTPMRREGRRKLPKREVAEDVESCLPVETEANSKSHSEKRDEMDG